MNATRFKRAFGLLPSLLTFVLAQLVYCADLPAGQVVWWGENDFWKGHISHNTNGLVQNGNEPLDNAVAVTGMQGVGLALKSDSTVFAFGLDWPGVTDVPVGLTNVVSIQTEGGSFWAIKRDGTIATWGSSSTLESEKLYKAKIVASLTNITAIAWGGYKNYLALKNNSTVLQFSYDINDSSNDPAMEPAIRPVVVHGQVLSNVMALAAMDYTPIVLKKDGTVFRLGYQTPGDTNESHPLFQYTVVNNNTLVGHVRGGILDLYVTLDPLEVGGKALSNVMALATSRESVLALKENGTLAVWGKDIEVPAGLSNVIAIASAGYQLALKRDGTVVAWGGDNHFGQTSVPIGLSNVVAIAAAGSYSLAVTTGSVPPNVFVQSTEMERGADLIFKGQMLLSERITNSAFGLSFIEVYSTRLKVISTLKGEVSTNEIVFQHYGNWKRLGGGGSWGGPPPPASYMFETGQCYLVFAARMDKPDKYYSVLPGQTNQPNEFRQLASNPHRRGEGVIRTLDARPLANLSVKVAHWYELNLLLKDRNQTNQLYAIQQLDSMSKRFGQDDEWSRTADFKREAVLNVLLPIATNADDQVALAAIECFQTEPNYSDKISPYADQLVQIANIASSASCRLAVIAALAGTRFEAVSNSLSQLLKNPDENIRLGAVRMLLRFPNEFAEQFLRKCAEDESSKVRAVVAETIGNGKIKALLPTLEKLWKDPVGRDKPLLIDLSSLKSGGRVSSPQNGGDVHTSTGYALLEFDLDQVGEFLKTNLWDEGFRLNFIKKLAPNGIEPYLPPLAGELKARNAFSEKEAAANDFHWPLSYLLTGNYGWAWDTLFGYVSAQTRGALRNSQNQGIMDALQIADDPGDDRTRSLYGFFLDKDLIDRAKDLRRGIIRRTEDKAIDKKSFSFPEKLKAFDEIDRKHSLTPGLGL